jgi:hypothetical protein
MNERRVRQLESLRKNIEAKSLREIKAKGKFF